MKKSLFLLLGFLVSCGVPQKNTDTEFNEYISRFTKQTELHIDVPINFSNLEGYVGACITYSDNRKEIEIDQEFWQRAEDLAREQLIFHELGHCVLNRDHDDTLVRVDGFFYQIPNSIMYPYIFGSYSFYEEFHQHYMEELIDTTKKL